MSRRGRIFALCLLALLATGCSSRAAEIAGLGLEGRLVYSQASEGLWQVDFGSGKVTRLWQPPEGGQVFGVALSPDGQDLAMAYAPPNPATGIPRADLYLANGDGSGPQPLLVHRGLYESFADPTWSPDGRWLYFTRSDVFISEDQSFGDVIINVERIPAGGGPPEVVISNAEQSTISRDGTRIAYLRFDLESYTRSLWLANIDGSEAIELLADHRFFDIASPRLSPDGRLIAFAGSGELQPAELGRAVREPGEQPGDWEPSVPGRHLGDRPPADPLGALLTWLTSPKPGYAHGLPWDFWTIPIEGGEPTKLTNWATDGAILSWSPNGEGLAMMHLGGLYVRQRSEPVIVAETSLHGGLDWVIDS